MPADIHWAAAELLLLSGASGRCGSKGGCYRRDRRTTTDGRTDNRPLPRPCSAYYAVVSTSLHECECPEEHAQKLHADILILTNMQIL